MKKQQYVAAIACLVAGAIGFASVYATEKAQEKKELAQQERVEQESQELSAASYEVQPKTTVNVQNQTNSAKEPEIQETAKVEQETEKVDTKEEEIVSTSTAETLHFKPENGVVWPLEGDVLLDYSMDATVYFSTLEQYRYNPAMVIAGEVNDKVFSVARGKIIEVYNSEETGCTVKQDLGDGYTAIYGQLKELNFDVGDTIESGQVIGYVSEPTKYYSVEGTNLYFALQKDGTPVNPRDYLPMQEIETLD